MVNRARDDPEMIEDIDDALEELRNKLESIFKWLKIEMESRVP